MVKVLLLLPSAILFSRFIQFVGIVVWPILSKVLLTTLPTAKGDIFKWFVRGEGYFVLRRLCPTKAIVFGRSAGGGQLSLFPAVN